MNTQITMGAILAEPDPEVRARMACSLRAKLEQPDIDLRSPEEIRQAMNVEMDAYQKMIAGMQS